MRGFLALATLLPLFAACDGDPDGDGLYTSVEKDLGTDPKVADSDGDGLDDGKEQGFGTDPLIADSDEDGLNDGEEFAAGTDGNNPDSDGDGYPDLAEINGGSDPSNPNSLLYTGGWPYNPDKDSITDPGWSGTATVGSPFPRFISIDQYGDTVDLYDFAGQGKPIVIDITGLWCYWCHEVAKVLERRPSALGDDFETLADMVEDGDIYWITVIYSGNDPEIAATENHLAQWFNLYPNEHIPLLLDNDFQMDNYLAPSGYPSMILIDENMVVQSYPDYYVDLFDDLMAGNY